MTRDEQNDQPAEEDVNPDNADDEVHQGNNRPQRLIRELRGLQPYNLPGRREIEEGNALFCFFTPEAKDKETDIPVTFQDAWHHPDINKREKWRQAIRLEYRQMIKNGVWRKQGLNEIPHNRKGIGSKWVFKEKKNGIFRARLPYTRRSYQ